jgi:hypothetical protein
MTDGHTDLLLAKLALEVYARYQRELVEALDLCPFARRAREQGAVRVTACTDEDPSLSAVLALADALAEDAGVEIGLLVFPRVRLARPAWQRFVGELHGLDAANPRPMARQFAAAAFHPEAEADLESPARLVSFLRRTPDPTIQLVRHAVLQRVRAHDPPETTYVAPADLDAYLAALRAQPAEPRRTVAERIARANLETVRAMTPGRVEALLKDIVRDRDARYAPLGVPPRGGY